MAQQIHARRDLRGRHTDEKRFAPAGMTGGEFNVCWPDREGFGEQFGDCLVRTSLIRRRGNANPQRSIMLATDMIAAGARGRMDLQSTAALRRLQRQWRGHGRLETGDMRERMAELLTLTRNLNPLPRTSHGRKSRAQGRATRTAAEDDTDSLPANTFEQPGADPDHCCTFQDGCLKVATHAHRKLWQIVACLLLNLIA